MFATVAARQQQGCAIRRNPQKVRDGTAVAQLRPSPELDVGGAVLKLPIVAMLVAAGLMLPATARSQVNVNVSIGQPPPVVVARPVMVPVTNSPVYFSPSYGSDLFLYDGRYYTVRDDQWFYAA